MAALQVLEETFATQGFHLLGFYSNDFGNQGGDPDACTEKYDVSFKQFAIDHVSGADTQPVWSWLLAQPNPEGFALSPDWNFNKYLISREGQLLRHWVGSFYPGDDPNNPNDSFEGNDLVQAIQAEL